jgi:proton glutamate symport protein
MGAAHTRPTGADTQAGVASASVVALIAAGNSVVLPAEGVALLLGVDFIVDTARTGVNIIGNSLAVVVDSSENRREAKRGSRDTRHTRAASATTVLQKETAQ